jgi:hypothetical protein
LDISNGAAVLKLFSLRSGLLFLPFRFVCHPSAFSRPEPADYGRKHMQLPPALLEHPYVAFGANFQMHDRGRFARHFLLLFL